MARSIHAARMILMVVAWISLMPLGARAQGRADNSGADPGPVWRFQLLYQRFVGAEMSHTYSWAYGLQGSARIWGGSPSRLSLRADGALYGVRRGHARIIDPNWTVERRTLGMAALDLSLTTIFLLRKPDITQRIIPYAGIGAGGIIGLDQLRYSMSRAGEEHEGHTPIALRSAFEAHGLIGAIMPVLESFSLVAEAQWIQAGKAVFEELGAQSAEDRAEHNLVHSVLLYPDMNVTGLRLLVGAQLGW